MRRRQWERYINLGLLTHSAAFWHCIVSYRIVSRYFVQYPIVSIVFPHGHIVASLDTNIGIGNVDFLKIDQDTFCVFDHLFIARAQNWQYFHYKSQNLIFFCLSSISFVHEHWNLGDFATFGWHLAICSVLFMSFQWKFWHRHSFWQHWLFGWLQSADCCMGR